VDPPGKTDYIAGEIFSALGNESSEAFTVLSPEKFQKASSGKN
jgi:hypothetical protein